jgi:hypothetical protein
MATSTPELVTLTIPANCADDFRCAVVDTMKFDAEWFNGMHVEMLERLAANPFEDKGDPDTSRADRAGALGALRQNARLLSQLEDGDVEMTVSDTVGALRYVLDRIGNALVERIAECYQYGPAKLADVPMLMERLQWSVEQGQRIGG